MRELSAAGYDTDKSNAYLQQYERFLRDMRNDPIRLFEIGIHRGGSLLMWRDYFPHGCIVGLDVLPVELSDSERIHIYQGLQEDTVLLDRIGREQAPDGFDVIIDDASHVGALTRTTFWHLFNHHLKPGGIFVIEDWGTGYWDGWPDGRQFVGPDWLLARVPRPPAHGSRGHEAPPHGAGMIGFVKELVDECGMGDITKPGLGISPYRESLFELVQVSHGMVVVVKMGAQQSNVEA
jgi:SAM-dependent methyltransferase